MEALLAHLFTLGIQQEQKTVRERQHKPTEIVYPITLGFACFVKQKTNKEIKPLA